MTKKVHCGMATVFLEIFLMKKKAHLVTIFNMTLKYPLYFLEKLKLVIKIEIKKDCMTEIMRVVMLLEEIILLWVVSVTR